MRREPTPRLLTASRLFPIAAATAILAVVLMALLAPTANAAAVAPYFSPTVQVDQPPGFQGSQPSLAVGSDGVVYVSFSAWSNAVTGTDVFFTKSANGGRTWSVPVRVNDDAGGASQTESSLALDARNEIFIVWTDTRRGTNDVYFTKSTDRGFTWVPATSVNHDVGNVPQTEPSIAVNETGAIFVAWTDYRNGINDADIYATRSTNGGSSFVAENRVNDDPSQVQQIQPSIAAAAGKVQVAWSDYRTGGFWPYAIYTASSEDGLAWSAWDSSGNAASSSVAVTVRDTEAPVPQGSGDRSVDEGEPLFFDGSASTDNVGVTAYAWNFGDNTSASTATASHVYGRPGTYAASLTVTDAAGNAATSTFTVTVRGVSPKASDLLGMIEILEGIVAILAAALAFVGWLLFGMRKREQRPPEPKSARPPTQRPDPMPPLPQTPPPREPDPLDMTLPPGPPSGP